MPIKPELIVVNTLEGLQAVSDLVENQEFIAFDTETTGLTSRHEIIGFSVCASEDVAYYIVMAVWNKELGKLMYPSDEYKTRVIEIIYMLQNRKIICHNGIFDCMMVEAFFKVRLIDSLHTDTMILAHLLNENRRVGLKELASSMYGESSAEEQTLMRASILANGGKITKLDYELYKADSNLIGKYGAKDAWLTYKLFVDLVPELYAQELDKFFYEDESMPLLRGPTYELNTTGLQVDGNKLIQLRKQLEAECMEAKDFIYKEIDAHIKEKYPGTTKANTFNIGSSQQLAWLLFGKLGLEFNSLTKAGKTVCQSLGIRPPYTKVDKRNFVHTCTCRKDETLQPEAIVNGKKVRAKKLADPWKYIACDKTSLRKIGPKLKWVERLLEYQQKMKLLSTYVEGIESRVQYGVIHPSFLQHGTTSGRYSSRNPNFQNLPRDDKRIKSCIIPRPNKTFIGADYSQLEPRVFAYFSGDRRLLQSFVGSSDFYSTIGMEVFGKTDCTPQKDGSPEAFGVKYKKLRDLSKTMALSVTYGTTAYQLSTRIGKSKEDAQQDIDNYFEAFPGVAQMMINSHETAKRDGQVLSLFGRPRRIPDARKINKIYGNKPHAELPYEARNLLNLSVNHTIQSTAASIVNRAAIKFYTDAKQAGIDCRIVLQVHDSLIIEGNVEDAENISILLESAMINTVKLEGIELEALPKIGINLSQV